MSRGVVRSRIYGMCGIFRMGLVDGWVGVVRAVIFVIVGWTGLWEVVGEGC